MSVGSPPSHVTSIVYLDRHGSVSSSWTTLSLPLSLPLISLSCNLLIFPRGAWYYYKTGKPRQAGDCDLTYGIPQPGVFSSFLTSYETFSRATLNPTLPQLDKAPSFEGEGRVSFSC